MIKIKNLAIFLSIFYLPACQTVPPATQTLAVLNNETNNCNHINDKICTSEWWQAFSDPILDRYMQSVIQHNHELSVATLTLQKAILNQQKTQTNHKITLTHQAHANRQQQKSLATGETTSTTGFDINLNASWEIDLWGKLQLQQSISEWEKHASQADRQAVFVNLTATAVREYFNFINIQKKLIDNTKSLHFQHKQRQYLQTQLRLGFISSADMVAIEQTINHLQQTANNLSQQRHESLHALTLLTHGETATLANQLQMADFSFKLPNNIPYLSPDAINYRPDIQAQLWRLAITLQQKNLLKKNQYPTLVLTAGTAAQSASLIDLLKVPVLNWGISLSLPTFNHQDYHYSRQIAQLDEQIATLNYQETIYKALSDLQSKLLIWQHQQQNHQLIVQAEQLAKKQLDYQQKRYQLGFISTKELEESKENYRQAQNSVTDSLINQAQTLVGLYQALGGRTIHRPNQ